MASADENSQFVSHCDCPDFPNCEVTLELDDKSRLSVCKDTLINKCEFFNGLFSANFKEKDSSEVKIQEVSRSDMLLFLECHFRNKALPSDIGSLCTLIRLADRFLCPSLQERINGHLDTESMFLNLPHDTKLTLIQAADQHKGACLPLLETSIRLCANLNFMDLKPLLSTRISHGTMMAVNSMVHMTPKHTCVCKRKRKSKGKANCFHLTDRSAMVEKKAWVSSVCRGKKIKQNLTYDKVKRLEIDQNIVDVMTAAVDQT